MRVRNTHLAPPARDSLFVTEVTDDPCDPRTSSEASAHPCPLSWDGPSTLSSSSRLPAKSDDGRKSHRHSALSWEGPPSSRRPRSTMSWSSSSYVCHSSSCLQASSSARVHTSSSARVRAVMINEIILSIHIHLPYPKRSLTNSSNISKSQRDFSHYTPLLPSI